jgi:predicted nuclease of predicted toxin-antitoxin system
LSLKVIVDVGVGAAVEKVLRELGHDVVSVRDLDPRMDDRKIVARAADEERLVVTMDKDFGELVFREGTRHAGVLLLRLDEATGHKKANVIRYLFEKHADHLSDHFSVYQSGRLRIRS